MARRRYKSDEDRLRVRPHVKVHLTVATHRRTAAVWADPALRGMLTELWRIAAEAYAGRTDGRVTLSPSAVRSITGCDRHSYGVRRLEDLCARLAYPCEVARPTEGSPRAHRGLTGGSPGAHRVVTVTVTIPKFAKKQGFAPRDAETPHASDSDSETQSLRDIPPAAVQSPPRAPAPAREPEVEAKVMDLGEGRGAGAHVACGEDFPEPDSEQRRPARRAEQAPPAAPERIESGAAGALAVAGQLAARFTAPSSSPPPAAAAPPRTFKLPRHLEASDIVRRPILVEVHQAAAAAGCVARGEAGLLEVIALAVIARRPPVRDVIAKWHGLIAMDPAARHVSPDDETKARQILRDWRRRDEEDAMRNVDRGITRMRAAAGGGT